jgi:hypothetical protein
MRRAYFTRNAHFRLTQAIALNGWYDHSEEYRACLAVDYAVMVAATFGLFKPFDYTNPAGMHNSGAFRGSIRSDVGPSKLNFPDVSEAEYSSVLGPFFRGERCLRKQQRFCPVRHGTSWWPEGDGSADRALLPLCGEVKQQASTWGFG